jgi:peroxiredoxin
MKIWIPLLLASPLLGQPAGDEILRKVAQTYSALTAVHVAGVRVDEIQVPGNPVSIENEYEFAARGQGRVRVTQKGGGEELWLIGNGEATWKALAHEKKWARMNTASLDSDEDEAEAEPGAPQDFRTSTQAFLIGRAVAYGRRIQGSTMAKQETYKLAGERVPVHVIRFSFGDAQHELWVDQQRFYVLQWAQTGFTKMNGRPVKTRVTMKLKKFSTGTGVADNLFSFNAPKGWTETEMVVFPSEGRMILTGQRAATFTLKSLEGQEVSLASLRGKVVVVDFWATWCPPCREELPHLEKLSKELAAKDILFVGVNDEESGVARSFVKKHGLEIPVLMDNKREVKRRYGIRAIPSLFVIDRDGVIRQHFIGSRSEQTLRKAILEVAEGKGG